MGRVFPRKFYLRTAWETLSLRPCTTTPISYHLFNVLSFSHSGRRESTQCPSTKAPCPIPDLISCLLPRSLLAYAQGTRNKASLQQLWAEKVYCPVMSLIPGSSTDPCPFHVRSVLSMIGFLSEDTSKSRSEYQGRNTAIVLNLHVSACCILKDTVLQALIQTHALLDTVRSLEMVTVYRGTESFHAHITPS